MSRNKHLTKLCIKGQLHLKYVLALPWKFEVTDSATNAVITRTFY